MADIGSGWSGAVPFRVEGQSVCECVSVCVCVCTEGTLSGGAAVITLSSNASFASMSMCCQLCKSGSLLLMLCLCMCLLWLNVRQCNTSQTLEEHITPSLCGCIIKAKS